MPRKLKVKANAKKGPAIEQTGEPVFGGNVDEVLAQKIVHRARRNAGAPQEAAPARSRARGKTPAQPRRSPLFRIAALAAILGGVALLVLGSISRKFRKTKKR